MWRQRSSTTNSVLRKEYRMKDQYLSIEILEIQPEGTDPGGGGGGSSKKLIRTRASRQVGFVGFRLS